MEILKESTEVQAFDIEKAMETSISVLDERKTDLLQLKEKYTGLTINGVDDSEGYKTVHAARMVLKSERVKLEKDGKALRDNANKFSKKVIERVNDLTAIISPLEDDLEAQEKAIDKAKEEAKQLREMAEAKQLQDRLNALTQYNFAHDWVEVKHMNDDEFDQLVAHARELHETELKRLAELKAEEERQRQEENERLQREREQLEKQRAEQEARERTLRESQEKLERDQRERDEFARKKEEEQKAWLAGEQKRLDEERRKWEEDKRLEQVRKETEERTLREAQEKIERESREKQEREEREKQEKLRVEALRPDKEKLLAYSRAIDQHMLEVSPELSQEEAKVVLRHFQHAMQTTLNNLRNNLNALL